jgi:hypothetical protein
MEPKALIKITRRSNRSMNGCIMLFLAAVLQTHFSVKMVMGRREEKKKMHMMLEATNCARW